MIYIPGTSTNIELPLVEADVVIDDLGTDSAIQAYIFDNIDIQKTKNIPKATVIINTKYGKGTIKQSVQGDGKEWDLRQKILSKKYTTQLKDIIKIKAK